MRLCKSAKQGIQFKCIQCGACCSKEFEGYVSIFWPDLKKMQSIMCLSLEIIAEKYLDVLNYEFTIWNEKLEDTGKKCVMPTLVLRFEHNQDCIFLYKKDDLKLCQLYEGRPIQCELFPFWSMIMTDQKELDQTMQYCKGIQPLIKKKICSEQGKHYFSELRIKELIRRERWLEYDYYNKMKDAKFAIEQVYPFLKKAFPI